MLPPAARLFSLACSANTHIKRLPPLLCSRTCPARLTTSPRGRRLGWAQLSARADPPAGAAAAARGSKELPVTRDSRPSPPTPRPTSRARGAGPPPPPSGHPRAPPSRSTRGRDRGPFLPPTDPPPTPPCRVGVQERVPPPHPHQPLPD